MSLRESSLRRWYQDLEAVLARWEREPQVVPPDLGSACGQLTVIPPAPPGSLGDQAYVEAAAHLAREQGWSPRLLLDEGAAPWTGQLEDIPQDWLPMHESARAVPAMAEYLGAMRSSDAVIALGADSACGAYGRDALLPLLCVGEAAWKGLRAGVVSLGFDPNPDPMFVRVFSALPPSVSLVFRDRDSLDRARSRLDRQLTLGADLAFAWRGPGLTVPAKLRHWLDRQRAEGRLIVILNIHSLLTGVSPYAEHKSRDVDALIDDVAHIVVELIAEEEASVVLVPHDNRGALSDEVIATRLRTRLPDSTSKRVIDVGRVTVSESRWLVGEADIVVSGRMHLAISSLTSGVPVVCLTYQEKFAGLIRGTGLDRLLLTPAELRSPGTLRARVKKAATVAPELRGAITSHVNACRQLAGENLAFL